MQQHSASEHKAHPPLTCDIYEDVTLLPMVGDITGARRTYALGAFHKQKPLPHAHRIIGRTFDSKQLPYIEPWEYSTQEVIYGGIFFMHWGHFLVESLQRLWYAKDCKLPIVWAGTNGFSFSTAHFIAWQRAILDGLGIDNEHIFLAKPTQFAKIHFPEPGFIIESHLHPEHARHMGYYHEPSIPGRRIYLSRAKIRGCANEERVEHILAQRGWDIIYPEELTVEEQLRRISTAQVCLMINGSAQHTLLLTHDITTRVVVIPRGHDDTFDCIAHAKSDNYFLLHLQKTVVYADGFNESNDVFTLDTHQLEHILHSTNDFTENLHAHADILVKHTAPDEKNLTMPACYREEPAPLNEAKECFYKAYFLYLRHDYEAAYHMFTDLQKRELLEPFMYVDYYKAIQYYHVRTGRGITTPLEEFRFRLKNAQEKIATLPNIGGFFKEVTTLFLIMGDFQGAIDLQLRTIEQYPSWSEAHARLAHIYSLLGNMDAAIEWAKKGVAVEPHKLKRVAELAKYLTKNKDYSACSQLIFETLKQHPTWEEAYVCLAKMHKAQAADSTNATDVKTCLDKAAACAQKAVELNPKHLKALQMLAELFNDRGNTRQASRLFQSILQQNTRGAERHMSLANIYAKTGNYAKAIEHAQKAVEFEPRNYVCKESLAAYYFLNNDYEGAMHIMNQAMYESPFWSAPHARAASIHAAKGDLDAAIDAARKAVAVEPYDHTRRQELELYRLKKLQKQHSEEILADIQKKRKKPAFQRIQALTDTFYAQTYLEVGVFEGETFLPLDVPFKIAVDPLFRFDSTLFTNDNAHFYSETSDEFFAQFPERAESFTHKYHNSPFKFDVIYLDGLHTFEQTLRDFENSLPYSHEKTVWIIDDTVPSNCFAAMSCPETQDRYKDYAGMFADGAWQGDVFKAVFAIHDLYPEFSFCTQVDNGNEQTILWRTEKPTKRAKVFDSTEAIARMRYEDLIEYAWVLYPVKDAEVLSKVYTNIDPLAYKTGEESALIIKPIKSIALMQELCNNLQSLVEELRANNQALTVENTALKKILAKKL